MQLLILESFWNKYCCLEFKINFDYKKKKKNCVIVKKKKVNKFILKINKQCFVGKYRSWIFM